MTYSHNSVKNNIKMTTTTAATSKTTRLKNVSINDSGCGSPRTMTCTPSVTPPVIAHSNSIASSTSNFNNLHHSYNGLSTLPPGFSISSAASSCSSTSSLGSAGNGNGDYFTPRQRQHQSQTFRNRQNRQSPQQRSSNPLLHQNQNGKRNVTVQNQYESQRTPHLHMRQSPATILGGCILSSSNGVVNAVTSLPGCYAAAGRKQHRNPLNFGVVKNAPIHPLIPTALTHFAGSKCFDAPAPTALPKPPQHWTLNKSNNEIDDEYKISSSVGPGLKSVVLAASTMMSIDANLYETYSVKSSKRNLLDDFETHNLKLLLNVQS